MTDARESPPGSLLVDATPWEGTSADPNDEQFGDVVDTASLADADAFDLVLVGEPYDGAVIGRTGAREGPAAIRAELAGLKTNYFGVGPVAGVAGGDPDASTGRDVATEPDASTVQDTATEPDVAVHVPTVADLGDVAIGTAAPSADATTAEVQDRVATFTEAVHDAATTPVFLGGDNSLTVGNVRPLVDAAHDDGERVGVVNFDAHLDVREPADGPTSGTPYRQLLESGLDRYLVVGARHFETTTAYAEYVEEHGGDGEVGSTIVTADEVASDGDAVRTRIASATADLDRVYVSVDVDVLDAAVAPGVSAPTPGGLQARELFSLVRTLGSDRRVAGFELVETAPSLDPAAAPDSPAPNRTVAAAARTVAHFVAGYAQRGNE